MKLRRVEDVEKNGGVWRMLKEMEECERCWKSYRSVEDVERNGRVWRMLENM